RLERGSHPSPHDTRPEDRQAASHRAHLRAHGRRIRGRGVEGRCSATPDVVSEPEGQPGRAGPGGARRVRCGRTGRNRRRAAIPVGADGVDLAGVRRLSGEDDSPNPTRGHHTDHGCGIGDVASSRGSFSMKRALKLLGLGLVMALVAACGGGGEANADATTTTAAASGDVTTTTLADTTTTTAADVDDDDDDDDDTGGDFSAGSCF